MIRCDYCKSEAHSINQCRRVADDANYFKAKYAEKLEVEKFLLARLQEATFLIQRCIDEMELADFDPTDEGTVYGRMIKFIEGVSA